jgi:hypothetical protein
LDILREIHKKYKGKVTQQLVRLDGRVCIQTYHDYFGSFTGACKEAGVPFNVYIYKKFEPQVTLLPVIIDSREKHPYDFEESITKKLDVGDYMLEGLDTGVVIERKEMNDLKGCIFKKRFFNEMERARKKEMYVVILVDCSHKDFMKRKNFGKLTNKQMYHQVKKFSSVNADVCQFIFTGGREESAEMVYLFCVLTPDVLRGVDLQDLYDKGKLWEYYYGNAT